MVVFGLFVLAWVVPFAFVILGYTQQHEDRQKELRTEAEIRARARRLRDKYSPHGVILAEAKRDFVAQPHSGKGEGSVFAGEGFRPAA